MVTIERLQAVIRELGGEPKSDYEDCMSQLKDMLLVLHEMHHAAKVRSLSVQMEATGNPLMILLAEALRHQVLREKPTTERLGYEIAERCLQPKKTVPQNDQEKALLNNALGYLDIDEYVFSYTHYDECSNGFYFRRS